MSRNSAVGIATGYGLDDQGVEVRVPMGEEFSLLHVVQIVSEAHPTSCPMGTGGEADHSPPTSAEVKKTWFYTSTPPYAFMT
jgi:hypothetical protein